MKNIQKVMKKDLDKVFKFPRMIVSTILLPGIVLFLIYAVMGQALSNSLNQDEDQIYYSKVMVFNNPTSFENFIGENEIVIRDNYKIKIENKTGDVQEFEDDIRNGIIDVAIVFSNDFDEELNVDNKPEIKLYSNLARHNSNDTRNTLIYLIESYKQQLLINQGIDIDIFVLEPFINITDEQTNTANMLSMLLPMLIITFVFAGSMSIGTDAVAGEKERGTLSTLLVAPIKKNEIILGKVFSTGILSLLSAISAFIGILASIPFAKDMFAIENELMVSYSFIQIIQILIVLIVLGLLASSIILITSTVAKTTKEAGMFAMPFYIAACLTAIISMFTMDLPSTIIPYLIPIYNISLGLKGILNFQLNMIQFSLIITSSLAYVVLISLLLIRMFRSEKILFSK